MSIIEEPAHAEVVVRPVRKPKRDRTVIRNPHFHRLQHRHFLMFDVLPFIATVGAVVLLFYRPLTIVDISLFLVMYVLTSFALSVGYHRLFTHRSFETSVPVRAFLAIFGCMAARSSVVSWCSIHRRHHNLADHEGDVHSPNLHGRSVFGRFRGWVYAQITWMWKHDYPNVIHYVPDLLRDKALMKVDRLYFLWVMLGLFVPGVIGGLITQSWMGALTGFLWGGAVRQCVVAQQTSLVNSLGHLIGSRPFKMRDNDSRNNVVLSMFTWGEGWHNNHHAFPESANFGFRWYQLDPGYIAIRVMEKLGIVWNVRRPKEDLVERRQRDYEDRWRKDGAPKFHPVIAANAAAAPGPTVTTTPSNGTVPAPASAPSNGTAHATTESVANPTSV